MNRFTLGLVVAIVAIAGATTAQAADLTWDANGTGAGQTDGAGTWIDAGQWWDVGANVDWNNTTPDNAIIGSGGAGGNISLGTVTAGTVLLDNFTGTYSLRDGSLDTSGGITIGPNAGNVNLPLSISGTGGITVNGAVRVSLRDGGKTFSGDLLINAGEVLDQSWDDLGTGNLNINGGVLVGYWGDQMTRVLGTGAGQVQVPGGVSGFSGQGSNGATVNFNNDDNFEVVWGSAEFNPSTLVLQSPWANYNGKLTWRNKLDLNGAQRTIAANKDHNGNVGGWALISGEIRNSDAGTPAGITKIGPGRLVINNTNNSYDGPTVVNDGILQIGTGWTNSQSIPGGITPSAPGPGSNLVVNDAMVATWYHFSRPLGTGGTEVQFTGGTAGITQRQGDRRSFNFGSTSTEVVWGSASFNPDVFVINDAEAGPATTLTWNNPIDLDGATRGIAANSAVYGGILAKNIRNSDAGNAAGLTKTGPGTITLAGTNTYDGGTTISEGKLQFTKLVSMPATGNVAVNDGATLIVNVGGAGEWTAGASGNGTFGGLLAGLGGQSGSTVSYSGEVTLGLVPSGSQTYSGVVGNVGTSLGLDHAGSGTLELSGNNTYSGDTVVTGGGTLVLSGDNSGAAGDMRISNGYLNVGADGAGLTAGRVLFDSSGSNPAILQASGTLNLTMGSGGDAYWPGSAGGFAATDSALMLNLNGGADVQWRSGSGLGGDSKLQMGSPTSTAPVTISNNLILGYNSNVRLFDNPNSSADISIFAGDLTIPGNHSLSINGSGTLWLQGSNAFGTSMLRINSGTVVRAIDGTGIDATAKLDLNGGVFESSGDFTRNIGGDSGEVYWRNHYGGFAAYGGALNLNLEGGADLNWNDGNTGFADRYISLGSATADNVVTLQNNVALNGGTRYILVNDNPDSDADYAVISGILFDGSGASNLNKRGSGTLLLNADNTYTGLTTVEAGTLGGTGSIAGPVTVKAGATLAPGASGGTLTVGILTMDANSTYECEADDLIAVLGDLDISGGNVTLELMDSAFSKGGTMPIFTYGTFDDALANFVLDATALVGTGLLSQPEADALFLTDVANEILLNGLSGASPIIPGDANGSGFVDDTDLAILLGNWESEPLIISTWALGNFTEVSLGDTDVDDNDLAVLLGNWTGPGPAGAAVPEPATLVLLGLGGLSVLRRRRSK